MGDLVYMKGGVVAPGEIVGQGCLSEVTNAQGYIFENAANASEVGDATSFPLGLSLDEMMEIYWRGKEMRIEFSFDVTSESATVSYDIDNIDRPTVTREADMILDSPWDVAENDTSNASEAFLTIFDNSTPVKVWNGLYYPYLYFRGDDGTSSSGFLYGFDSGTDYGHASFDVTFELAGGSSPTFKAYAWSAEETNLSATISFTEYWPHAKAGGGDKWDTSTGLPL